MLVDKLSQNQWNAFRSLKNPKNELVYSHLDKIFRAFFIKYNFALDFIFSLKSLGKYEYQRKSACPYENVLREVRF